MKNLIRLTLAAAFLFVSSGAALACPNCDDCPMHKKASAEKGATAGAQAPGEKKPGAEKPKCECQNGKDCACAKAGKPCNCGKPAPKA